MCNGTMNQCSIAYVCPAGCCSPFKQQQQALQSSMCCGSVGHKQPLQATATGFAELQPPLCGMAQIVSVQLYICAVQGVAAPSSSSNRFCRAGRLEQGCRGATPHCRRVPHCQQHPDAQHSCRRIPQIDVAGPTV